AWLELAGVSAAMGGGSRILLIDRAPARILRVERGAKFSLSRAERWLALAAPGICPRRLRLRRHAVAVGFGRERELQEARRDSTGLGVSSLAHLDSGQHGWPVLRALLHAVRACAVAARCAAVGNALPAQIAADPLRPRCPRRSAFATASLPLDRPVCHGRNADATRAGCEGARAFPLDRSEHWQGRPTFRMGALLAHLLLIGTPPGHALRDDLGPHGQLRSASPAIRF